MADLNKTRKHLGIAIAVLILLDLAAGAALLSPLAGSHASRQQQLLALRQQLKQRESAPWRGLDAKIPQAKQEIDRFYKERFPSGYSEISGGLERVASGTGVRISGEKYTQGDASIEGLQQIEIDSDVSGDYLQLVRFINGLERSQLFFLVEGLDLGGEQNGVVRLHIKVQTYLRTV